MSTMEDNKFNKQKTEESSKKEETLNKGCMIIIYIILFLFFSIFVKPLIKSYMRYKTNQRNEATGVWGAGLDRARYIIEEIEKEAPFNLEMLGESGRVYYGLGSVMIDFTISDNCNPLGIELDYIYKNKADAKEFLMTEIQAMPKSLRKAMGDIVKEKLALTIHLYLAYSHTSADITLESYEIDKALKRNTNIDPQTMSLLLISKSEKMLLPVQVDELTFWTDSQLNDDSFIYVYEVDDSNIDLNAIDLALLKQQMKSLYAHPQKPMQKQIELCIKTQRSIGYKYIGTRTNKTFTVSLTPIELQSISQ